LRENKLLYSSHLPLGVPNGLVIHHASGINIVLPEYIDEILNLFNMETIRMVLVAWKRLEQESIVLTLDE
jgi:hypothetical protein